MEIKEIIKKHPIGDSAFYSDYNLFQMKGIMSFDSIEDVSFPFVIVEERENEKILNCYLSNTSSESYSLKWDGEHYSNSEEYQDDDASKWIEYISVTQNSIFRATIFRSDDTEGMFLNDLIVYDNDNKIQYFFSEKSIPIKGVREVVSSSLRKNSILIKKTAYSFDEMKNELLIKESIMKNLIDNDNKRKCRVLNQKGHSFLWDIFLNRERGNLLKENEC